VRRDPELSGGTLDCAAETIPVAGGAGREAHNTARFVICITLFDPGPHRTHVRLQLPMAPHTLDP